MVQSEVSNSAALKSSDTRRLLGGSMAVTVTGALVVESPASSTARAVIW